jgi:hypothetical protein
MGKEKKIVVDINVKTAIKNDLKLGSYPTIRKALNGDVSTPQMLRIRKAAKELGGVELELKPINVI